MAIWLRSHSTYAYGGSPGITTFDVPRPASYVAGNVLVILAACVATTFTTIPSGWTQQASYTGTTATVYVYTKIATGSEPTTYTFDTGGTQTQAYFVALAVGGVASSSQIGGAISNQSESTGSPINIIVPGYTSSANGSALWMALNWQDYTGFTFTPPSTYTTQFKDLDLNPIPITYATALKDGVTNGQALSTAVGSINSSGTKVEFFTGSIVIASGSVDPYQPVFDDLIFDSVVFDTGPGGTTTNVTRTYSATGTLTSIEGLAFNKAFGYTATGTATSSLLKVFLEAFAYTATGANALRRLISRLFSFTAIGTQTEVKQVRKSFNYSGIGTAVYSDLVSFGKELLSTALGVVTFAKTFIGGGGGTVTALLRRGKIIMLKFGRW